MKKTIKNLKNINMKEIQEEIIQELYVPYISKLEREKIKWDGSIYEPVRTLVPASRGKFMENVWCQTFGKIGYDVTIQGNVKKGFDCWFEDKLVEIKYASEGLTPIYKSKRYKNKIGFGSFTFDQIRPYSKKYEYITFWFVRPDEKDCLYFTLKREELQKFVDNKTLKVQHKSTHSYLWTVTSQETLDLFYEFGDGTWQTAINRIIEG